jgi:endoglucanase
MKNDNCFLKSIKFIFNKRSLTVVLFGLFLNTPLFSQLPTASEIARNMKVGWNIVNTLEVPNSDLNAETYWGNPKVNQTLITTVRNAGFNTIRIPCAWDSHANKTTMVIDTAWLKRVKEVVDYCYANNLYIIMNCHWDNGWLENNVTYAKMDTVNKRQKAYWTQIANYFKEYDEHLLFAGANEPNVDSTSQMAVLMSYHQTFIDAVRSTGGNNSSRVLVIQGPSTDIDKTNSMMKSMPVDPIANRLMVEIHYYTPWNFCGLDADASWGKMFYFWGKDNHSTTNTSRNPTWGEESTVESYFQMMKTKFVDKGIPMILGEYGAIKRTSLTGSDLTLHTASRQYYFQYITNAALRYGMIPYCWETDIFNRTNGTIMDQGVFNAIMRGATSVAEQQETMPAQFSLKQNYPNPFNPTTMISFSIPSKLYVSLKVYDVLGREVETLLNEQTSAGFHEIHWNATGLPGGVYFYRLSAMPSAQRDLVPTNDRNGQSGLFSETKKLILLK